MSYYFEVQTKVDAANNSKSTGYLTKMEIVGIDSIFNSINIAIFCMLIHFCMDVLNMVQPSLQ